MSSTIYYVIYIEISGGKSEIMTSLAPVAGCTLPRQHKKAKSCIFDLGLYVLDLEGKGPWVVTATNRIKKPVRNLNFMSKK